MERLDKRKSYIIGAIALSILVIGSGAVYIYFHNRDITNPNKASTNQPSQSKPGTEPPTNPEDKTTPPAPSAPIEEPCKAPAEDSGDALSSYTPATINTTNLFPDPKPTELQADAEKAELLEFLTKHIIPTTAKPAENSSPSKISQLKQSLKDKFAQAKTKFRALFKFKPTTDPEPTPEPQPAPEPQPKPNTSPIAPMQTSEAIKLELDPNTKPPYQQYIVTTSPTATCYCITVNALVNDIRLAQINTIKVHSVMLICTNDEQYQKINPVTFHGLLVLLEKFEGLTSLIVHMPPEKTAIDTNPTEANREQIQLSRQNVIDRLFTKIETLKLYDLNDELFNEFIQFFTHETAQRLTRLEIGCTNLQSIQPLSTKKWSGLKRLTLTNVTPEKEKSSGYQEYFATLKETLSSTECCIK
ncbi:hypothetical protein NEHOM01_0302 [Nematocida homosporus]|uniref:uncharacterized protein n=1 Tax=Nematocida homosporus TaxID=1912981 RepID=UPI00221F013C|nr:uncharacterized protein NEHOM01_0302 [Nematocida homosporus]KAI5184627.1 hypothetical protein NEHOM01_0302 [Nematocida homosporus]